MIVWLIIIACLVAVIVFKDQKLQELEKKPVNPKLCLQCKKESGRLATETTAHGYIPDAFTRITCVECGFDWWVDFKATDLHDCPF